jgi:hypothetical protein
MAARFAFEYVIVRVVPHVEREEFINSGVIVFCDRLDYLAARIELDPARLRALAPDVDVALLGRHLEAIPLVCAGGPAAGPIGALTARERWRWLVAPRSTCLQTSAPHAGLCDAPGLVLDSLLARRVRFAGPAGGMAWDAETAEKRGSSYRGAVHGRSTSGE